MARALIVGCGCRGQALGEKFRRDGWQVRGTTRDPARAERIEAAGIEPAVGDPDRPGTILELVADVTLVFWLLGSATGGPETVAAIHGPRLERLLEKLVDSPVRGFVYEAAGGVQRQHLEMGAELVRSAAETWRIPIEIVQTAPDPVMPWLDAMAAARVGLVG